MPIQALASSSLSTVPLAWQLAGGNLIFFIGVAVILAGVLWGLYTRRGSGIGEHPHGNIYTSAPGATGASEIGPTEPPRGRSDPSSDRP